MSEPTKEQKAAAYDKLMAWLTEDLDNRFRSPFVVLVERFYAALLKNFALEESHRDE